MTLHTVVSGWLLGPPSGANRRLLALLGELGAQLSDKERVTVLHRAEFTPPELPRIEWRAVDIPQGPSVWRARAEQRVLPDLLRELQATVYDHGFLPLPFVGVPTCLTIHDLRDCDGHGRWPSALARAVVRRSCRRANAIVTPSEWTARRLQCVVPQAPTPVVVHNAVTFDPGWLDAPAPRTVPDNGYLLHVGHLERRKNLEVVIDAIAKIPANVRPQLWLLGNDAGHGGRLERHASKRGVSAFVHQLGSVDEELLPGFYRHAKLVVMPSRYEGFGLPALEALAHGRPVLAADSTALREVVGEIATMLPVDDADSWANAITQEHPDEMHDRAERSTWASCFDWHVSAADLLHTWRGISG